MSNWSSGDVIANGIKIHYVRTGGTKLPLVLAHGFSDNGLCWTRVAQVLEKDYDVIMADARGHGLSDAPESGYSAEDHAADLAGLIQALHLDKPALMGHSMGAATVAAKILEGDTGPGHLLQLVGPLELVGGHRSVDRSEIARELRSEPRGQQERPGVVAQVTELLGR